MKTFPLCHSLKLQDQFIYTWEQDSFFLFYSQMLLNLVCLQSDPNNIIYAEITKCITYLWRKLFPVFEIEIFKNFNSFFKSNYHPRLRFRVRGNCLCKEAILLKHGTDFQTVKTIVCCFGYGLKQQYSFECIRVYLFIYLFLFSSFQILESMQFHG